MIRDIRFRGKQTYNGEWVRGDLRQVDGRCFIMDYDIGDNGIADHQKVFNIHYEVDPETVGQYTGVPDENGTDIYEKDRFKLGKDIGTVVFENGSFWVNWDEPYSWGIDRLLCNFRCRGEVVNPDLLEGGYE